MNYPGLNYADEALTRARAKLVKHGEFAERLAVAPLDKPAGICPPGWRESIRINGRFTEHAAAPGYGVWWVKI